MINYEVHFSRTDGTPILRVFIAATTEENALYAVRKMRSADLPNVKVWRGINGFGIAPVVRLCPLPLTSNETKTALEVRKVPAHQNTRGAYYMEQHPYRRAAGN